MTPADIARVLAKAAAFDSRTVGEADILAWFEALGDLDVDDALAAVTRHYRESTDWLKPAHVRRIVGEIARERRRAVRERAELEAQQREAIERGPARDRSADVAALLAQVRTELPPGDPNRLSYGRARWGKPIAVPADASESDRIRAAALARARSTRTTPTTKETPHA